MVELPRHVKTLGELLEERAASMPGKPAVFFGEETVSFGALDRMANRYANVFRELGVGPGDRVCLFIPNRMEFLYAYFGLIKLGAMMISLSCLKGTGSGNSPGRPSFRSFSSCPRKGWMWTGPSGRWVSPG